ncbi:MAG: hypothetical protein QNJ92_09370 [Alphaproteobacteria bacterium]|nr:hypothetical protein [Alphaproteobacteria bacterium]
MDMRRITSGHLRGRFGQSRAFAMDADRILSLLKAMIIAAALLMALAALDQTEVKTGLLGASQSMAADQMELVTR